MSTAPRIPAPAGAPGIPKMPPTGAGFPPPGAPPEGIPGMPMPEDLKNLVLGLFGVMAVLIIESVLPTRVNPELRGAYLIDLNMLVMHGGLERTAEEFSALLEKSGFAAPTFTTLPLPGEIVLIETTPVTQ